MRQFLIAHDLSQRSERALARGLRLAQETGAAVTVLHVVDSDLPPGLLSDFETGARQWLEHDVKAASGAAGQADIVIVRGMDFAEIVYQAKLCRADLVILGQHRQEFLREVLIGTTVERVMRTGRWPVLVVRGMATGPYRRVLVAVDFSDTALLALKFAADLLPSAGLRILHAVDLPTGAPFGGGVMEDPDTSDLRSELAAFVARAELTDRAMDIDVAFGPPAGAVPRAARDYGTDLVVVGTHGRSGIAHAMLGSVAEAVVRTATMDVLAVRPLA